ncbi:MAG TPA: shikimate kinase [Jatrophihabitantaceae bacterium]|nr:shikimate kinase [Jatrophihabitantaceae bacterium]
MTPRVVLVGLPGAGKTTTGRRLARILGVPFADSDELVEADTGRSVAELFAADGETAFRAAEAAAVITALRDFDGVLSLGGGAVMTESVRTALSESAAPVVLLRSQLPTLVARVGDATTRPLLAERPAQRLDELAEERTPIYRQLATLVVDTDERTPGQVASQIAARLHRAGAT